MLIRAQRVARVHGDRTVLRDVDLQVTPRERLALVGPNGGGKSTLLRLLAGLDSPSSGSVTRHGRVALLEQHVPARLDRVVDAVTPSDLTAARHAFEAALAQLADGSEHALAAFASAEEAYRLAGGYDFEARAAPVLAGLGLSAEDGTSQLSGGQARRVLLARLLLAPADVYLLDEPTNHLDEEGAAWLERWIAGSDAAFVIASHDRAFLDAVATTTAELDRGVLTVYPGGYSEAMSVKEALRAAQERDYAAYQRKRAALREESARLRAVSSSADRFSHRRAGNVPLLTAKNKAQDVANTLAGRANAMERRLERLEEQAVDKPYEDRRVLRLHLPNGPLGPNEVLTARNLRVERGGRTVLHDVDLFVRRGDRVALTGPNGAGKSTLLGALAGRVPCQGEVRWGPGLTLYVAGQQGEELDGFATVADALLSANEALTPHDLHDVAAQLQLPGPRHRVADLSGGQRTRLSFARLGVTRAQVLVLDEPTNHLDIRTIEALEEVLVAFPGTVLFASHDRRLVKRVASRTWRVERGVVRAE